MVNIQKMPKETPDRKIELFNKSDMDNHPEFNPDGEDRRLFNAIRDDSLVIFYGAGVSMLAGCAGWEELAENIIDAFPENIYSKLDKTILKEISTNDPKKVISICYQKARTNSNLLENVYFRTIKDSVKPTNKREFSEIHSKIFDLNAISYITTNIDRGIESIDRADLGSKEIVDLTNYDKHLDLSEKIKYGNIFYLHGTVDNIENTIFTVDRYFNFYSEEKINRFLREIFGGKYSVLFIGYSLNEYEILQNIFLAVRDLDREVDLYNHFLLTPIYTRDLAKFNIEKDYFKIFSIKAIPYFIDYEGYGRLKYVLDLLRRRIKEYKPDVLSIKREIDEV
jgi:hypothetical protein